MAMKVFVYSKKTNKRFGVMTGIVSVKVNNGHIIFTLENGEEISCDTKIVKTTIYQN